MSGIVMEKGCGVKAWLYVGDWFLVNATMLLGMSWNECLEQRNVLSFLYMTFSVVFITLGFCCNICCSAV